MSIRSRLLLLAAATLLATQAFASDRLTLRIGDQKGNMRAQLEAADALRDLPYDIRWAEFPAAAPLAEALNAGAIDAGIIGDAPLLFVLASGAPVKAIAVDKSDPYGTALLVRPDAALHSAADLKGKRIATGRGSIGHHLALKALDQVGLSEKDVEFRFLGPVDAKIALANGSVDAWSTWDPYTTIATTQYQAKVLASGEKLLTNHLYFAATSQAIANKRQQLDDFIARVDRAYRWTNAHPEEYAAAQSRVTGLSLDVHIAVAKGTHMQPVEINDQVIGGLQATADIYQEEGIISKHIDVSQGFDKSFNVKRPQLTQASR